MSKQELVRSEMVKSMKKKTSLKETLSLLAALKMQKLTKWEFYLNLKKMQ